MIDQVNKKVIMRKKIFIWLVFSVFVLASTLHARASFIDLAGYHQEKVLHLSSVEVSLWPEFDRADILVIYRITIPTEVFLPVELRLRIPAAAGIPNAVAARQPGGGLMTISYTQEEVGEWSWITFQAIMPEIQVEYYDPALLKDGNHRYFSFFWPGEYSVDQVKLEIQEPVGAKEMRIKPGMVTAKPGTDGLMYYQLDVGSVEVGQVFNVEIDYLKSSNKLSSGYVPVEPSGPLDASTQGRMSVSSALPWLLGSLGFLLILGGGIWYWKTGQGKNGFLASQPSSSDKSNGAREDIEEEGSHVYCPTCGNRASPGDRYCRACGTLLGSEN
jgi:predicted RNA-binding Zn-ribbon protein involved in translation (DUF1610 family)